ncbi:facilitated trehalose transporter Tret1-2 homolog isoform X2 [Musca domestica]|uniref:Facilitated trehalose transporter Tret1-2 homolog isoform X2 n=1 Tax=Musca domestica TaxID=7370 RepID=A0A1I8MYG4_MUSDO|nr:facilitated trehalose transporter Tret1-2 homolog isoform X2 [Musca domestica]XP_058979088.1 facilitated trehalose transporter Tret1-2 homolog isoform X2 [Musca domestica]
MVAVTDPEKTVSQEDNDPSSRNPMLYDPLQDGVVKTSKKMQYFAAMVVCLGAVSAGTALAWTSPVLPQISEDPNANTTANNATADGSSSSQLQLTLSQQTWVSSLLAIGAFLGALPTGYIADYIGRRYTALVMDIPFIVAWTATIFANSATVLYFARFTIGLATGSFCVVAPMYISEIAESSIRGTLGTLFQLTLSIGILLVYIIGAMVTWTTLSVLCLLVPVALFIGMLFLPETPTYLLKKGRRGDAALSLKWLWGRYCDSRTAIQQIQSELDQAGGNASFSDVFRIRAARNGLIISMLLMFFQQFSGVNAVIFYTVPIFKSAGSTLDPSICSIIVGFVQVVMTFTSSLMIEKAGRKSLLIFSSTIMTICLAILGAYFDMKDDGKDVSSIGWLPLLCVVLYMITFSVGYGPIPWLMMGELFLPDVKATAVALTVMSNWFSVFLVTKTFGSMITAWGSDMTFWFFAFCMFVATMYVAFMVLETKGKSSSQIQSWLDNK